MDRHFQHELESLKTILVKMGSIVEENITNALLNFGYFIMMFGWR